MRKMQQDTHYLLLIFWLTPSRSPSAHLAPNGRAETVMRASQRPDNQPKKNYFHRPAKINAKTFCGMVAGSISLRHERQGNESLLKIQRL